MNKLIAHLNSNPQEAMAICEGKAMPIGVSPKEILQIIKTFKVSKESTIMKYWG